MSTSKRSGTSVFPFSRCCFLFSWVATLLITSNFMTNAPRLKSYLPIRNLTASARVSGKNTASTEDANRLNVLIVYPDDWGARDLEDANPILKTPTFTQLAKEGIRFTQNAVTTSICWISRATLFTGQYVSNHRSTYLFRPIFASEKSQWQKSWPSLLRRSGYWVGHIGKWQYKDTGYRSQLFDFSSFFEGWLVRTDRHGNKIHIAEVAKNETLRFLRERPKDKPFAVTVAFYPPKGISDIKDTLPHYAAMYKNVSHPEVYDRTMAYNRLPEFLQDNTTEARKRYLYRFVADRDKAAYQKATTAQYATLSHIDDVVAHLIAELKLQGVYNDTMIIVTADNGEFHGAHSLADKWYPYSESINVPLIIKDPRIPVQKRGALDHSFTLNIDLAEIILGAAKLDIPEMMDGRDIADLYADNPRSFAPWRDEFYYEFPPINHKIPASRALVRKDWKYIDWHQYNHEELFNVAEDPFELNNVANQLEYTSVKDEMRKQLDVLRHKPFSPRVPGTRCDPLWPAGTVVLSLPNCSSVFPDSCCPKWM